MIIDFHTHTFPRQIAARALEVLGTSEGLKPFTNGTNEGLIDSMDRCGVDISILLPVVTKVIQTEDINRIAALIEEETNGRLISFGGIHPEDDNYVQHLKGLKADGVKGIKLHPVFQHVYFDDIRYKRIVDKASELDLITMVHTGLDISMPDAEYATAAHLIPVIKELKPKKLLLAHMGSWKNWEEAEEVVGECPEVYIDTSFVLPTDNKGTFFDTDIVPMSKERFCRIAGRIGTDRVLFGTDSPWTDQQQAIEGIRDCGLSPDDVTKILGSNAFDLLK